jgi:hypothetical protein
MSKEKDQLVNKSFDLLHDAFKQQREIRDGSMLIKGLGSMFEELGGPENAIGKIFIEGHADAMSSGKGRNRLAWARMFMDAAKLFDEMNAATLDLSGVDEEDLRAYVTELSIKLLSSNKEFRRACLLEVFRREPALLAEVGKDDGVDMQEVEIVHKDFKEQPQSSIEQQIQDIQAELNV